MYWIIGQTFDVMFINKLTKYFHAFKWHDWWCCEGYVDLELQNI